MPMAATNSFQAARSRYRQVPPTPDSSAPDAAGGNCTAGPGLAVGSAICRSVA